MKLVVLKLLALFVLIVGVAMLGIAFSRAEVAEPVARLHAFLAGDGVGFNGRLLIVGGILTLLGIYAFIPRLPGGRRAITYQTEHGEVNVEVRRAEATLRSVINAMPEVKSVKVMVRPDKEKRRAIIHADAVVINQDHVPARRTFEMITQLIEETATDVLGLEIQQPIQLRVADTKLDAKAASKSLHNRVAQRGTSSSDWAAAGAATASAISAASPATGTAASAYVPVEEPAAAMEYEPLQAEPEVNMPAVGSAGMEESSREELAKFDIEKIELPAVQPLEDMADAQPLNDDSAESGFSSASEVTLPPLSGEEAIPAVEPLDEYESSPLLSDPEAAPAAGPMEEVVDESALNEAESVPGLEPSAEEDTAPASEPDRVDEAPGEEEDDKRERW